MSNEFKMHDIRGYRKWQREQEEKKKEKEEDFTCINYNECPFCTNNCLDKNMACQYYKNKEENDDQH